MRASYANDALSESTMGEDYEQILGDLLTPRYSVDVNGIPSLYPDGSGAQAESAWNRLGEILGEAEDISDSESVGSMGFLRYGDVGDGSESDGSDDAAGDLRPDWSEMSPDIIMALEEERDQAVLHGSPRSPRPRARRGSSEPKSPALRPVLTDGYLDAEETVIDEDLEEFGPAKSSPHTGPAGELDLSVWHETDADSVLQSTKWKLFVSSMMLVS